MMNDKKILRWSLRPFSWALGLTLWWAASAWAQSTTWTGGAMDSDWHNSGNWTMGVPNASTSAIIPTWATNFPILYGTAHVLNLTVQSGATLDIGKPDDSDFGQLTVHGNATIAAGATVQITADTVDILSSQLVVSGTLTHSGTINLRDELDAVGCVLFVLGNVTLNGGCQIMDVATSGGFLHQVYFDGNLVLQGTGHITIDPNSGGWYVDVNGSVSVPSGANLLLTGFPGSTVFSTGIAPVDAALMPLILNVLGNFSVASGANLEVEWHGIWVKGNTTLNGTMSLGAFTMYYQDGGTFTISGSGHLRTGDFGMMTIGFGGGDVVLHGATLNANANSLLTLERSSLLGSFAGDPALEGSGIKAFKKGSTRSVVNIWGTAELNQVTFENGGCIYFDDSDLNIKNGGTVASSSEFLTNFYGINGENSGILTVENGGTLELNAGANNADVEAIASLSYFNTGSIIKLYNGSSYQANFIVSGQQYNNTVINIGAGWVVTKPLTSGTLYGNGTYYNLNVLTGGSGGYQTVAGSNLKVSNMLAVGSGRSLAINGTLTVLPTASILNTGTIIVNEMGTSGWLRLQNPIAPGSFPQGVEVRSNGLMSIEAVIGFGNAPNRPTLLAGGKIRVGNGNSPGTLNADGPFTVVSGATFEIMPDGIMNLNNNNYTVYSGGTFAIRSDASGGNSRAGILMNLGTGVVIGNVIVERQFTGGQGYRYISSPISSAAFNTISGFTPKPIQYTTTYPAINYLANFFWYDESLTSAYGWMSADPNPLNPLLTWKKWVGWESSNNAATPLEVGRGYAIRTTSPVKISVTGSLNNDNITALSMTKQASTDNPNGTGWQLVGNPYPSPIQWSSLRAFNASRVNGSCYRFEHTSLFKGQYNSHNGFFGTPSTVPNTIAMFQAFFVEANGGGGNLQFTNAMRTASPTTYYRSAEPKEVLRLRLIAPNELGDEILVYHQPETDDSPAATPNFDPRWDGRELIPYEQGAPSLFSLAETGEKLCLNATSELNGNRRVQLGVDVASAGEIRLKTVEMSQFDPSALVLLVDTKTGTHLNLRHTEEYVTYFDPETDRFRFHLQYYAPLAIEKSNAACETPGGQILIAQTDDVSGWFYAVRDGHGIAVASGAVNSEPVVISDLRPDDYTVELRNLPYNESVTQIVSILGGTQVSLALNAPRSATLGEPVTFNALASGAAAYEWNFGDGTTVDAGPSVTHTYISEGTFNVSVKASNETCDATAEQTISVGKTTSVNTALDVVPTRAFAVGESVVVRFGKPGESFVEVSDLSGRIVATAVSGGQSEVKLGSIPAGVYLVRVSGAENGVFKVPVGK